MKRKTLYAAIVVLSSCWLGLEALIRAQQGGPGGAHGGAPGSQDSGETPDVPGSGPISPIDRPAPNQGEAPRGSSTGTSSATLDPSAADRVRSSILNDPALMAFNQKRLRGLLREERYSFAGESVQGKSGI